MGAGEFREMTDYERGVLDRLLSVEFEGVEAARQQARAARVRPLDDDGCLEFQVTDPARLPAGHRMVADGEGPKDAHGVPVLIQLSSDAGRLLWLEFVRFDGDPNYYPEPEAWAVRDWPQADRSVEPPT